MIELRPHGMAHGGEAVARHDGKTFFVGGALPGELVTVCVDQDAGSWARALLVDVIEPSEERIEPPCPYFGECGGCDWQYAAPGRQPAWKRDIVAGQLQHLGGVTDPPVAGTMVPGPPFGYRNRLDLRIRDGRPALHRRRSNDLTSVDDCLLAASPVRELMTTPGRLNGVERLTLRAGLATGERLVLVDGALLEDAPAWDARVVVRRGRRIQAVAGEPHFHEEVAGLRFRITADAFFQVNTAGAGALVELVENALEPAAGETLLDAYAGGGLFAATVGRRAGKVVAIESARFAKGDLRVNLAAAGVEARILGGTVERLAARERADVVVCDPPRRGLGREGVAALAATGARAIAYVSCDPASLARDTRLLTERGYRLDLATPVDMFPQTHHIETVGVFRRSS